MKEFKGTKGEWKVEYDNSNYCESYLIETDKEHVCTIDFGYNDNNLEVVNCNAKLIAAAPDLLEALQMFVDAEQLTGVDHIVLSDKAYVKANKAIEKALS